MGYFDNTEAVDKWYLKRWSKFTCSENFKLLKPGDTYDTYVEAKVIELTTRMIERPVLEEVKSLRHGKQYEYPAFERYVYESKNYNMEYTGSENPLFLPDLNFYEESGGTPDGVMFEKNSEKIEYGIEIKCPYNPAYHFRRLDWKDQWDIKQNYPLVYTQIQNLIMITGAFGWDFISFDDRQISKMHQAKIIQVKPDRQFIDNLQVKIHNAITDKYRLLSKRYKTEVKNKSDFILFTNQQAAREQLRNL